MVEKYHCYKDSTFYYEVVFRAALKCVFENMRGKKILIIGACKVVPSKANDTHTNFEVNERIMDVKTPKKTVKITRNKIILSV